MSLLNQSNGSIDNKENVSEEESNFITSSNVAGIIFWFEKNISNNWIIDTGAIDHMCNTFILLKNLKNVDNSTNEVVIRDGSKLKITKVGNIFLDNNLILKDVLFVRKIQFNLKSVH